MALGTFDTHCWLISSAFFIRLAFPRVTQGTLLMFHSFKLACYFISLWYGGFISLCNVNGWVEFENQLLQVADDDMWTWQICSFRLGAVLAPVRISSFPKVFLSRCNSQLFSFKAGVVWVPSFHSILPSVMVHITRFYWNTRKYVLALYDVFSPLSSAIFFNSNLNWAQWRNSLIHLFVLN